MNKVETNFERANHNVETTVSVCIEEDDVNTSSKKEHNEVSIGRGTIVPQNSFATDGFVEIAEFDDRGKDEEKSMPVMSTINPKGYRVFGVIGYSDDQASSVDGSESEILFRNYYYATLRWLKAELLLLLLDSGPKAIAMC